MVRVPVCLSHCDMCSSPTNTWKHKWITQVKLPCWPQRGQQVSHQRLIRGIDSTQISKHTSREYPGFEIRGSFHISQELQSRCTRGSKNKELLSSNFLKKSDDRSPVSGVRVVMDSFHFIFMQFSSNIRQTIPPPPPPNRVAWYGWWYREWTDNWLKH